MIGVHVRLAAATNTRARLVGIVGALLIAIEDAITIAVNVWNTTATDPRGTLVMVGGATIIAVGNTITIVIHIGDTTATHSRSVFVGVIRAAVHGSAIAQPAASTINRH
jgi:hypothetical protein